MSVHFSASIISGSGIAMKQKVPTLNLALQDLPLDLEEGIYACKVYLQQAGISPSERPAGRAGNQELFSAVMHYGPRPVHNLPLSCEVHILDQAIDNRPESVSVEIIDRIRDVRDFKNQKQLQEAIQSDIAEARAILGA